MRVRATKTVELEIHIYEQSYNDPDDGTAAGVYAQVGPPGDQCDWMVGPFRSRTEARTGAVKRLERMGYKVDRPLRRVK
jgi:hypothetical protein